MLQRLRGTWALVVLTALLASSATAVPFTNLYVFGDSLVDAGNTQAAVLAATGGAVDVTPAAAGYFAGRFSNGPNAADVLNQQIEGSLSVASLFGGDNYAFGGARARTDADFIPDLTQQVGMFLGNVAGVADPGALYLINVGGNDVRDILIGGLAGAARQAVIDSAVLSITNGIAALSGSGAQYFLVAGVGNVGSIPEALAFGPAASAAGTQASLDINAALSAALLPNITIFDTFGLFGDVAANPASFGLPAGINTTIACLDSGAPSPGGPPTCSDYAFFDSVHPTTQLHEIFGAALGNQVPEPSSFVLFVLAITSVASRLRRAA